MSGLCQAKDGIRGPVRSLGLGDVYKRPAEIPDPLTIVGAGLIIGSTFYIARREAKESRMEKAALNKK